MNTDRCHFWCMFGEEDLMLSDRNKLQGREITSSPWGRRANHCNSYWTWLLRLTVFTGQINDIFRLPWIQKHNYSRLNLPFWTIFCSGQKVKFDRLCRWLLVSFSRLRLVCGLLHERSGYTTLPPHQVHHAGGGVLRGARRERRAARAIFKATVRVIAEVGSDAALCCTPADL